MTRDPPWWSWRWGTWRRVFWWFRNRGKAMPSAIKQAQLGHKLRAWIASLDSGVCRELRFAQSELNTDP